MDTLELDQNLKTISLVSEDLKYPKRLNRGFVSWKLNTSARLLQGKKNACGRPYWGSRPLICQIAPRQVSNTIKIKIKVSCPLREITDSLKRRSFVQYLRHLSARPSTLNSPDLDRDAGFGANTRH